MSIVVRFSLDQKSYERLKEDAKKANRSLQDYIRATLLPETQNILSVEGAIKRIQANAELFENTEFTLPQVFGEEWDLTRETGAGMLGKHFGEYIDANPQLGITLVPDKLIQRRAVYTYKK